jgi:hypothetical protein
VFPVRYELDLSILLRRNSVLKVLRLVITKTVFGLCKHSGTKQIKIATNALHNYGLGVPGTIGLPSLNFLFTSWLYSSLTTLTSFSTDTISSYLLAFHLHLLDLISPKSLSTCSSHLDVARSTFSTFRLCLKKTVACRPVSMRRPRG